MPFLSFYPADLLMTIAIVGISCVSSSLEQRASSILTFRAQTRTYDFFSRQNSTYKNLYKRALVDSGRDTLGTVSQVLALAMVRKKEEEEEEAPAWISRFV